jgi:hypothetical protein
VILITVQISVCKMIESKSGVFSRAHSPYVEIEACKSDSYSTFIRRAALKCRLEVSDKELSLFKINGARVLDCDVSVKGKPRPWTLGNYLGLLKKSPSAVKLGVGYVVKDSKSSCSSDMVCKQG